MSCRYPARSASVAAREIDGQMIVMNCSDSSLFSLNEVATVIWNMADGRTELSAIAQQICAQFDVAAEVARADAEELVARLATHGILQVWEHPAGASPPVEET